MQINVSQLLQESVGSSRDIRVEDAVDITGNGKKSEISGECRLLRTPRSILVSCSIDTAVELTCGRCLVAYRQPLKVRFDEEFLPTVDVYTGARMETSDEPGSFTINDRHILDLAEAVRQYALMAVPMKAVCREDCAGLCPSCGQDLNLGKCDCTGDIDPRWSALARLKKE